eukprot:Skav201150  [mRNA]  locus=scaffold2068:233808:234731:- [translate_table: standard]
MALHEKRSDRSGSVAALLGLFQADEIVCVLGRPDLISIVQLDAVGISFIPNLQDLPACPASHVGLDQVTNLEAGLLSDLAGQEVLLQICLVQVPANENKSAGPGFVLLPLEGILKATAEKHVHALEHKLGIHALHGHHALVPEHVLGFGPQHDSQPTFQLAHIQFAIKLPADRAHRLVMLMLTFRIHELGIHLQDALQGEGTDVDQLPGLHLAVLSADELCCAVDLFHGSFHLPQCHVIHQIRFVQNDAISKGNLLHALIFHTFGLLLLEMFHDMFGVHHRDDAIEFVVLLDVLIHEEGLGHWCWVC